MAVPAMLTAKVLSQSDASTKRSRCTPELGSIPASFLACGAPVSFPASREAPPAPLSGQSQAAVLTPIAASRDRKQPA